MHVHGSSPDCSAASHAHPLPTQPSPSALKEKHIRALIARQTINVALRGLHCEHATTAPDILTPKIRRSPFNRAITASHLDLVECWKSLSHAQSKELLMWYQFLHRCLESEVRANLHEAVVKDLLQSEEAVDEVYLVPRMLDSLNGTNHRIIDVEFVDLIDSMMGMFHDRYPNAAAALSSNWSQFPGGLSLFLQNFLRVQDCFLEVPGGHCFIVDFEFKYVDSFLVASGDVNWQLPDVRFLNLSSSRSKGQDYRITPFVLKETYSPISPGSSSDGDDYIDEITYAIPRSPLTFDWDALKQCFKTILPTGSEGDSDTVETILSATITTPFPDDVRFERQSRWSIKLDVTSAEHEDKRTVAHESADLGLDTISQSRPWNKLVYHELFMDTQRNPKGFDENMADQRPALQNTFDNTFGSQAQQKRKVYRPDVVEVNLITKRRRGDSAHENESEPSLLPDNDFEKQRTWYNVTSAKNDGAHTESELSNIAPHFASQHHQSSSSQWPQERKVSESGVVGAGLCGTRKRCVPVHQNKYQPSHLTSEELERTGAATTRPYGYQRPYAARSTVGFPSTTRSRVEPFSVRASSHPWKGQPDQYNSPMSTLDIGSRTSESSPPNSAVEKRFTAPQQEQIRSNYREFAERKLYKNAGLISPVSEGERQVFEGIFLENEDWSPVDEGVAVDVDIVMGET